MDELVSESFDFDVDMIDHYWRGRQQRYPSQKEVRY